MDFRAIAQRFRIPQDFQVEEFAGKGNINLETALVAAGGQRFLLQQINQQVFSIPTRVMAGMTAALRAQHDALQGHAGGLDWRIPTLVPTLEGELYHQGEGTWRMMTYIEGTQTFKSLAEVPDHMRLKLAREVGRGLAVYSDLTESIDASQVPTSLPGYRNSRLYFHQLHAALEGARHEDEIAHRLPEDEETRESARPHFLRILSDDEYAARRHDPRLAPFIELALAHEQLCLELQALRERGDIRQTAIHGDTKIENFLFDPATGNVVALVDLDTIMPHTWLADWGDMVRSLVNVAGEKERDLSQVVVDADVYEAVADGFLSTATTPTDLEITWMPRAVQAITLELGVRFLADYLRGDTYFRLAEGDPPDLNRVRAQVQLTLFEQLLAHEPEADRVIARYRRDR